MSMDEKKLDTASVTIETTDEDDKELLALGYKPSFKREFTNLDTVSAPPFGLGCTLTVVSHSQISFAFSIMVGCSASPYIGYDASLVLLGSLLKYFHDI